MNVWKLTAVRTLAHSTEDIIPVEGKVKIRVTKVFVNADDAAIFQGTNRVKFPRIPGRFAVGVISNDEYGLKKGTRVLLHATRPEEETGTQKPDYTGAGRLICGETTDGYLRDFVFAGLDDFTPLPDAVNDEKGLLVQYVAQAKAAIDALNPHKGDHVAVVGADLLGLCISQLLIYQQVAPVLIDNRADRLEFARSCGIYYAYQTDEKLIENLATVTGGRLADGVIYTKNEEHNLSPLDVCAPLKTVVLCGSDRGALTLPASELIRKQLSLHGVADGTDYIETAINLVANKAVDFSSFLARYINADNLPDLFRDYTENPKRAVNEMNVVNLI